MQRQDALIYSFGFYTLFTKTRAVLSCFPRNTQQETLVLYTRCSGALTFYQCSEAAIASWYDTNIFAC